MVAATESPLKSRTDDVLAPGLLLADGRFQLLEQAGAGGHGVVYKALEKGRAVHRYVAIKFLNTARELNAASAVDRAAARFEAEAHLAGQVQHPNVIQIYTDGRHADRHFYVMEYVKGSRTLSAILDEAKAANKRVPFKAIKRYFSAIARGLRAIHEIPGVFHRDIKLHNVLVSHAHGEDEPIVKIIDFGIAHNPDIPFTKTGCVLGTEGHVAPEYARCDPSTRKPYVLDHRVDLFALGVALYQFTTFEAPFASSAESLDVLFTPPRPSSVRPMPLHLETIILKLLAKDRAHRYANCDALLADLAALDPDAPTVTSAAPSFSSLSSLSASLLPSGAAAKPGEDDASLKLSLSMLLRPQPAPMASTDALPEFEAVDARAPEAGERATAAQDTPTAAKSPDLQLTGATAWHVDKLNKPQRKPRLAGIKRRDRVLLALVGFCVVGLVGLTVGKRTHKEAAPPPRVVLPVPPEQRQPVTANDILREARAPKTQFIEPRRPDAAAAAAPAQALRAPPASPPRPRPKPAAVPRLAARDQGVTQAQTLPEKPKSLIDAYETTLPEVESASVEAQPADAVVIPAGTQAHALLSYALASNRPRTMVEATLPYGLNVRGRRVAGPGAKLLGKARYQQREGKWFVEIDFDRLVDVDGRERRISAMATQGGVAGLEGRVAQTDRRNEATTFKHVLKQAREFVSDKPEADLARDFERIQNDDLRPMQKPTVTVSLPRKFVFDAQFTKAS